MRDIKFSCPNCSQSLEAPPELAGQAVDCPSCKSSIEIPQAVADSPAPAPAAPPPAPPKQTRPCPFCGEEILLSARKCKHCGEFLDGTARSVPPPAPSRASEPERTIWEGRPSALYWIGNWVLGVLLLPLFGVGLILILVGILQQRSRLYTVTNRRVVARSGVLARATSEVAIRDIRSVNMVQSLSERIFGLGTVQIGSAGTAGIEVQFVGVSGAQRVRDLIRGLKDQLGA